jgi:hypothetical protein
MQLLNTITNKIEDMMTAITFAEAGDHKTALQMMGQTEQKKKRMSKKMMSTKYVDNRPRLNL